MFYKPFLVILLMFSVLPAAQAQDDFLEPEAAFQFSAKMLDAKTIAVSYEIAPGYYMYRERFKFTADGARLGAPVIPAGKIKFDETFDKNVETYLDSVTIILPVEAGAAFTLHATAQGCADKGLCYAPMISLAKLSVNGGTALQAAIAAAKMEPVASNSSKPISTAPAMAPPSMQAVTASNEAPQSEMSKIASTLKSGKLHLILPWFLLLGLGLSFTPCLLPMVPILSFIIVGEGVAVSRSRAFALSVTYSLGMALVYTALGIAAGLAGAGLAAALQNPWVLGAFAILMFILSLSMFGVYQLQIPPALQMKLMHSSKQQSGGKLFGVFMMGAISALIVGPCVAAPLAGTLIYISQTRDLVVGGSALFAMAMGMSVPLLLVGLSAGSLLPRAGPWMAKIKQFFGVLMLAMALWMASSIVPVWLQMLAWATLALAYGIVLLRDRAWQVKLLGLVLVLLGVVEGVGLATGGRDVWAPLAHFNPSQEKPVVFSRIKSTAQLDAALASARGKTVLLDFYADWCVSCKEMEKLTFTDKRVKAQLRPMVLLQADVTANDSDDQAMLKRFNLFGPPGIIFFDKQGGEIKDMRVIGYQPADKFLRSLSQLPRS